MEQEIFKPIEGYEGLYEISNFGRVKSLPKKWAKNQDVILKNRKKNTGYLHIVLYRNKVGKTISIHRLVATAFCEKKEGMDVVNHLNSIRSDNRASNLEWTNASGNAIHSFKFNGRKTVVGRRVPKKGSSHHNSKILEKDVVEIRKLYYEKKMYQRQIALLYNVSQVQIGRIVNSKNWTHI